MTKTGSSNRFIFAAAASGIESKVVAAPWLHTHRISAAFAVMLSCLTFLGCTTFTVSVNPDNTIAIEQSGAPLVNRNDNFIVKHEWLAEDNTLHTISIERNTEENADAQARLLETAFQMGLQSARTTATGIPPN